MRTAMVKNFDDVQKMSKDGTEAAMQSLSSVSKTAQAIATESAEYARKSFEQNATTLEKLMGIRSVEGAIEVQTAYAKTAYEGFVAQATKMSALYADLAKSSYKPFESYFGKISPTA